MEGEERFIWYMFFLGHPSRMDRNTILFFPSISTFHLLMKKSHCSLITDRWKENIFSKVLQQLQEHQRFHNIDAPKSTSNENLNFYYTSKSKSNNIFNQYRRRSRYTLGETLLVAHDIVQEKAINEDMVNNLQVNDYAFVKRSDQSWTYAHLIKRYNVGGQNGIDNGKATSSGLEHSFEENEVMIFALDHSGQRTKSFTKKKWAKFIKCESR